MELCTFARKLKFDLRLFTNGTLIDEKIAKKIASLCLSGIEISLYGTQRTHDLITNKPGSFKRVMETIKILKDNKIPITIKCPVMKPNFKDIKW